MPPAVRALTAGRGADFVFDTVGSAATLTLAFACTRKGGAVVLTGLSRMDAQAAFPMFPVVMQEKRLLGSVYGSGQPARDIPTAGVAVSGKARSSSASWSRAPTRSTRSTTR